MNQVNTYTHPIFGDVRTVEQNDNDVWFVAKDIAETLGYEKPENAISTHCKAFKTTSILELHKSGDASSYNELRASGYSHNDLVRKFQIIPERDVYRLVMRSKLPAAEKFEEWVVAEVLPSIRKTGGYGQQSIDWSNTAQVAGLLSQSLEQVQKHQLTIQQQASKIEADQPKVCFYQQYADAEGLYTLQNAGRVVTGKPNKFIGDLKGEYLFYQGKSLVAKAKYTTMGLFEMKSTIVDDKARLQTYVTPKGIQYFAKKFGMDDLFSMQAG
ncbi:BRO family protein [Endozoicomonas sp. ALE010]